LLILHQDHELLPQEAGVRADSLLTRAEHGLVNLGFLTGPHIYTTRFSVLMPRTPDVKDLVFDRNRKFSLRFADRKLNPIVALL
jgi:hypothetical protein